MTVSTLHRTVVSSVGKREAFWIATCTGCDWRTGRISNQSYPGKEGKAVAQERAAAHRRNPDAQ